MFYIHIIINERYIDTKTRNVALIFRNYEKRDWHNKGFYLNILGRINRQLSMLQTMKL